MSTPVSPAPQTPPVDAATAFINAHTVVDYDVPLLDECPICLDNFSTEPCHRIIGIEGCTHHVGLTCLQKMLRSHPNEEKKCPLCRTVWIAAPAAPARRTVRTYTLRELGMLGGLVDIGENIAAQVGGGTVGPTAYSAATANAISTARNSQGMMPFSIRNQRNTTNQSPMLVSSSSESEDYDTQLENFEQLTRDIASIRTRARNTQFSRSRRRRQEPKDRQRGASITANQGPNTGNDSGNATAGSNPSGGGSTLNFFNRTLNPFRPTTNDATPTPSITIDDRLDGDLIDLMAAARNRDREGNRSHTRSSPPVPQNQAQTFGKSMRVGPPSSHTASPSPASTPTNVDPTIGVLRLQQSARHIERTTQLDQRAIELTQRETRLIKREGDLLDRERELGAREDRAKQLMNTVRSQRDAIENLLRRQREEIDRIMR